MPAATPDTFEATQRAVNMPLPLNNADLVFDSGRRPTMTATTTAAPTTSTTTSGAQQSMHTQSTASAHDQMSLSQLSTSLHSADRPVHSGSASQSLVASSVRRCA